MFGRSPKRDDSTTGFERAEMRQRALRAWQSTFYAGIPPIPVPHRGASMFPVGRWTPHGDEAGKRARVSIRVIEREQAKGRKRGQRPARRAKGEKHAWQRRAKAREALLVLVGHR